MTLTETLLAWYDAHSRTLPWRGIQDSYATWVSETMLQQTRVETVLGYYKRFLAAYPTVDALAAAPIEDVLKLWEGLGYYRRAQNLHKGAQQVMTEFGGVMPQTVPELSRISGVGPYTAGAIASIAFGQAVPAVDGNVVRVVSRLRGIRENVGIPSARRSLTEEASRLVPGDRPGDFNQALMDLGATVCVPGTPDCAACPLRDFCDAFDNGDAEELPVLPRKNPPRTVDYDVCLILHSGRALMRRRTETLLQGLWVFPMLEGARDMSDLPGAITRQTGVKCTNVQPAGDARHVFTHQIWRMQLYVMDAVSGTAPDGWQYVTLDEMSALPLPTAMKAMRSVAMKRMTDAKNDEAGGRFPEESASRTHP